MILSSDADSSKMFLIINLKRPGFSDGFIIDGLPLSTSNLTAVQVISQNSLCYFGLFPLQKDGGVGVSDGHDVMRWGRNS